MVGSLNFSVYIRVHVSLLGNRYQATYGQVGYGQDQRSLVALDGYK